MVRPEAETASRKNATRHWPKMSWSVAAAKLGLVVLVVTLTVLVGSAGCGSSVEGTYSDPGGAITLDLKSGGNATISFMGETAPCTYTVDGKKLALSCKGQAGKMNFTIQDDGSLAGPPGTFIPPLRKKK
jgi:hypothetical protein